jgi:cytochrome b561
MLRNSQNAYGSVAVILHSLIALLSIGQIAVGLTMTRLDDQRLSFELIQWHKSFGLLTLALVVVRIGWRLFNRAPDLPASMPGWERLAAQTSHGLLYVLMLAAPVTGWLLASASVLAIPTYAFYLFVVPHLPVARTETSEGLWTTTHHLVAYAFIGMIALHVAAALRHHLVLKDNVLARMLRAGAPRAQPKSNAPTVRR